MKEFQALNCTNHTSQPISSNGGDLNFYCHGDFAGGAGVVVIQVELANEVGSQEYVEFDSLTFSKNTIRILKIPNLPKFRVVTRGCNGVNIKLSERV